MAGLGLARGARRARRPLSTQSLLPPDRWRASLGAASAARPIRMRLGGGGGRGREGGASEPRARAAPRRHAGAARPNRATPERGKLEPPPAPTHASVDDTACGGTPSAPPIDVDAAARAPRMRPMVGARARGAGGWGVAAAGRGQRGCGGRIVRSCRSLSFLLLLSSAVARGVTSASLVPNAPPTHAGASSRSVLPRAPAVGASFPPARRLGSKWLSSPAQHR